MKPIPAHCTSFNPFCRHGRWSMFLSLVDPTKVPLVSRVDHIVSGTAHFIMLSEFPTPEELKGAIQGTCLYLLLYAIFLTFQSFSKFYLLAQKKKEAKQKDGNSYVSYKAIKYYNKDDFVALLGDRTVGNFAEWYLLFLPLLWMHAVFVDPKQSFTICLCYTATRALYPFLFKKGVMVVLSTGPAYLIKLYLAYQVATQAVFA